MEPRSVHNTRRDHCKCERCRGWGHLTWEFTGGEAKITCTNCKGTGKKICWHRDSEPANYQRESQT